MASLSNINGIFDVHSTGAILFSTSHGTSGQILRSNGNAAPTWVAASTVIGGPYLPLTGGTLSGPLAGTSSTFSGIVYSGGGFRNSSTNSSYNLLTRNNNNGSYPFYCQNSLGVSGDAAIARFAYGSYGANTGTAVLDIRSGTSYFNDCNVGIGTNSPTSKLHLRDPGVNSDVGIKIGNDSRDWNLKVMGSVSDSFQIFTHDNSNVMTILPSGNVGIGETSPTAAKLQVRSSDLGSSIGDQTRQAVFHAVNGNSAYLEIKDIRTSAIQNWTGAAKRIQMRIDSTYMGYMQFNGSGNNYGISFGTGATTSAPGNVAEKMRIASNGAIGIGGANYGTSGQVLTSNGNAAPSWQAAGGSSPFGEVVNTYSTSANVNVATTVNASTVSSKVSGQITITASSGGSVITKTFGIYETSNLWFKDESGSIANPNNSIVISCSASANATLTFTVGDPSPTAGYGMTVSIKTAPPSYFNI